MGKTLYIPKAWDLPVAIRKRLGESVGKQRLMNEDGHLLLRLHQAPKAEDDEVRGAMVSRRNPAREWKSAPTGGGLTRLDAHVACYRTAIHQLDEEVESAITPRQYFEVMRRMHPSFTVPPTPQAFCIFFARSCFSASPMPVKLRATVTPLPPRWAVWRTMSGFS